MNGRLIRCVLSLNLAGGITAQSAIAVTIDTVPIGNAGNAADVQPQGSFGAVAHDYRIGRTEVTNAQYVEFLNAVDPSGGNARQLYHANMTSDARGGVNFSAAAASGSKFSVKTGREQNPVVFASWFDAIRFANWLHNGQGGGDTETGAYNVGSARNAGALWFLPNEDEWYKAAYHQNDGVTGNYWDYPVASDLQPDSDEPPGGDAPDPSNTANFFRDDAMPNNYNDGYAVTGSATVVPTQNYLTDVGAYAMSLGPYGTVDQGGNVTEWNETFFADTSFRGLRGGSWLGGFSMAAAEQFSSAPTGQGNGIGFRVATVATPSQVPGDFNGDGSVDGADLIQWQGDFGVDNGSDADDDGDSDGADFLVWQSHLDGELAVVAAAPFAAPAPEPAGGLLAAVGAAAVVMTLRLRQLRQRSSVRSGACPAPTCPAAPCPPRVPAGRRTWR